MVWRKQRRITMVAILFMVVIMLVRENAFNRAYYAGLKRFIFGSNSGLEQSLPARRSIGIHVPKVEKNFGQTFRNVVEEWKRENEQEVKPRTKQSSCKPHEVVVLIKTHKTGSSTMTNILNRYADLNDLKLALPSSKYYRFRWPTPFHWSAVDLGRLGGDTASILCNHARYNRPAIELVMKNGAKYVTILRHPASQFESMFNYMDFNRFIQLNKSNNPLVDFLEDPVPFLYKLRDRYNGIPEPVKLVKNPMTFDLGLSPPGYNNITKVKEELTRITQDFDLVMITEYFDESLILLKKSLCWQFEDILYIKFNQKAHARELKLSNRTKQRILDWNSADWMFYKFFNKTLWSKIHEYGPEFWTDLRTFRKLNERVQNICVDRSFSTEKAAESRWKVRSYRLNRNVSRYDRYFCRKILRNEVDYIKYFRTKFKQSGSYQHILEMEGRKKRSTRELVARLQMNRNVRFAEEDDSIPRAVS